MDDRSPHYSHRSGKQADYFSKVLDKFVYDRSYVRRFDYGTAGFRDTHRFLEPIMYKMGLLAVMRSKTVNGAIGLMITASHNLEDDNGIKLVEPSGEMLEVSWETIATELVNIPPQDMEQTLKRICREENIDMSVPATVIIGRDTRKSGCDMLNAVVAGIKALDGTIIDLGVVTTPQLHFIVACKNNGAYGNPILEGYYLKLATAFKSIRNTNGNKKNYKNAIYLDAANGVGTIAAKKFQEHLGDALIIKLFNDGNGELNLNCGADYVKVQLAPPLNTPSETNVKCASIDGDADRIVYFYIDKDKTFHLLDGDRIATLIAVYFKELLEASGLSLRLGMVQTAYANGASTKYISNVLALPIECVSTGVKHLHKKAKEFDIGIYFEANGHGTVLFKDTAKGAIKNHAASETLTAVQREAATKLMNMIDIINETVGDAFSDMLLVETILYEKDWDIIEWENCYKDLPCKQLKCHIADRNVVTTTNAERRCLTPSGLQDEIDKVVSNYQEGRCFVRPSGTENLVRIYAECQNISEVDELCRKVSDLVYTYSTPKPH